MDEWRGWLTLAAVIGTSFVTAAVVYLRLFTTGTVREAIQDLMEYVRTNYTSKELMSLKEQVLIDRIARNETDIKRASEIIERSVTEIGLARAELDKALRKEHP